MVKKFTAFKVLIGLIILGIIAIPVTAALSLAQFKYYQNPIDSLTPGVIDNSTGIITKSFTIYAYNPGYFDINSLIIGTTVLNNSLYAYNEPYFMIWGVPKGGMIPINVAMRVNTTTLNATGTIGNFLNTTSFLGQIILDARYAYSLTGISTMQITQLGPMSPMYNLSVPVGVIEANTSRANVTFVFGNFLQGYPLHIDASLSNGTTQATGSGDFTVLSAGILSPSVFNDFIELESAGTLVSGSYSVTLTVTSPFKYTRF